MDTQLDELWRDLVANVAGSSMTREEKRRMYRDTLTMLQKTGWKGYETVVMVDTQMIEAFSDTGLLMARHLDGVLEKIERTIMNRQARPETQDEQYALMWEDAKEYFRWKQVRERLAGEEGQVRVDLAAADRVIQTRSVGIYPPVEGESKLRPRPIRDDPQG